MKRTEMIRAVCLGSVCLCIAWMLTACSNKNDVELEINNGDVARQCPTGTVVVVETLRELTQVERLEAESRRLIAEAGREGGAVKTLLLVVGACFAAASFARQIVMPTLPVLPFADTEASRV